MIVLILNSGSSSIKFQLFNMANERVIVKGLVEKIGEPDSYLIHDWGNGNSQLDIDASDHSNALEYVRKVLVDGMANEKTDMGLIDAIGHRVVHGGEDFFDSALITNEVEELIERYAVLAPLHNPAHLIGIRAARDYFPGLPHVAVFDTSFHQSMPARAFRYAIPNDLYTEHKIRRYGFHGTSHRYVSEHAGALLGTPFTGITAHLGNGCSVTAIQDDKSIDTSMGLTPLEGLAMGTRSGDIDPAVVFHLVETLGYSLGEAKDLLLKQSGLKGLSGVSNDLRDVEAAAERGDKQSILALEVYAYRIRKYIGAYLAILSDPQGVVVTGGVGEHGTKMRELIFEPLKPLGLELDIDKNCGYSGGEEVISRPESRLKIIVIPTNEELMIARDTVRLVINSHP